MRLGRLVWRSLGFHLPHHLGAVACVALATGVVAGSLSIGDSVEASLASLSRVRLGHVELALPATASAPRAALAEELAADLGVIVAPVLMADAVLSLPDETASIPGIRLYGVDERFFQLADRGPTSGAPLAPGTLLVNGPLAEALGGRARGEVVVRMRKPGAPPLDLPLSREADAEVVLRLPLGGVLPDAALARFDLRAGDGAPRSAFVPLAWLQQALREPARANLFLVGAKSPDLAPIDEAAATAALRRHLRIEDVGLSLARSGDRAELRSDRIVLDPSVVTAAERALPGSLAVLTWLSTEIRAGDRSSPYALIAALGASSPQAILPAGAAPLVATIAALDGDGIAINRWLADDLHVLPGDEVEVRYYAFGRTREPAVASVRLKVRAVIPLEGAAANPTLMPDIPGLAGAASCRDWDPGVPIAAERIRDVDEQYWREHRGTPKAFLPLATAERLFASRWGRRTALRWPGGALGPDAADRLARALDPRGLGLAFSSTRPGDGARPAFDLGGIFLGAGLVLVGCALLLATLLFSLALERRAPEIATLRALGYSPARVRWLLLGEGALVAALGSAIGTAFAVLYGHAVLHALSTVWREAAGLSALVYRVRAGTLAGGAIATATMAVGSMAWVLRRHARLPVTQLFAESDPASSPRRATAKWAALLAGFAVTLVLAGGHGRDPRAVAIFFAAGFALLASGLLVVHARLAGPFTRATSLGGLALRSLTRRSGRNLAATALLSAGSCLVVAVSANRQHPDEGARERHAGTGGFALWAETALPIASDPASPAGRADLHLDSRDDDVAVVPLRRHDGDEASCRRLEQSATPTLFGVDPESLARRDAFTFAGQSSGGGFRALLADLGPDEVPAIGDEGTVVWALHRRVGDTIDMIDGAGRAFRLRIVGVLATSVLQGGLILDEGRFVARFPSESGYRLLLIDAPARSDAEVETLRARLGESLRDSGGVVVPAWKRLALFEAVENTYLSIFEALGGLGLLLGFAGSSVLVFRDVLERRHELALLSAIGFPAGRIRLLVLGGHALRLALGLGLGAASALVAAWPAISAPGASRSAIFLALVIVGMASAGALSAIIATAIALDPAPASALRAD